MEVSVIDYGAVPDGETDCTDALQAAINAAGGWPEMPGGTYKITRPLEFPPPSDDED